MSKTIINEINRLTALREQEQDKGKVANQMKKFALLLMNDYDTTQADTRINYYNSGYNLLTAKIQFWKCLKTGELPLSLKIKINELTDDWLHKGWEYFGQEKIKEDSKSACDEIAFINEMYNRVKVIDDTKKKKTRRGGKNKKLNN
tara:strand:+ start:109 stop:546 length:438 start_codon:yes stop_codon:yes gene_type:complete